MPSRMLSRRYGCEGSTPVSRSATVTPVPSSPGTVEPGEQRRRDRRRLAHLGRVRDPHRVHADHLAVGLHERERDRVETGGEAVEHSHVAVVGREPRARRGQPREELLLHAHRRPRPLARLRLGRGPAVRRDALRERRLVEEDDVARRSRRCSRGRRARPASPPRRSTAAACPARSRPRRRGRVRGRTRRRRRDGYEMDAYASSAR